MTKRWTIAILLLVLMGAPMASAQDAQDSSTKPSTEAQAKKAKAGVDDSMDFEEIEAVPRASSGFHNAKFEEYRDLTPGVSGGLIYHRDNTSGGYFRLDSHNLGLDDAYADVEAGNYGSYRVRASYRQTPHNYAFGAMSLFSGVGSSVLTINPSIQSAVQGVIAATPVTVSGGAAIVPLHGAATGAALTSDPLFSATEGPGSLAAFFSSSAQPFDLTLRRDIAAIDVDVPNKGDFDFGGYLNNESKDGTTPYSGYLGQDDDLGFINELPAPVKYETNNHGVRASYAHKNVYMGLDYDGSTFNNSNPSLVFSNAYRTSDAAPPVVATPPGIGPLGPQPDPTLPVGLLRGIPDITMSGAQNGLMPLAPSNDYDSYSFTAAIADLPWKGKFTLNTSQGFYRNSSAFAPYTDNSALLLAANIPAAAAGPNIPFGLGNLDGKVDTEFWLLRYACSPWSWMHTNAHYRSYDYSNTTPQYVLGKVVGDTAWDTDPAGAAIVHQTYYESYKKSTTGVDFGLDVFKHAVLTLAFDNTKTDRTNTSVASQNENQYSVALDANPSRKVNARLSYENAHRTGNYDPYQDNVLGKVFDAPSGTFQYDTANRGWFPFLLQFDKANRDHDRTRLEASWSPDDKLTLTGSVDDSNNVYPASVFGLGSEQDHGWAVSADYSPRRKLNITADFETRDYNSVQMSRHWKPWGDNWNGVATQADPFFGAGQAISNNSNWITQDTETETLWALALRYDLLPDRSAKKLKKGQSTSKHRLDCARLTTRYSETRNDGSINYSSAVGSPEGVFSAAGDDFNAFVPLPWPNVDNSRLYTLDSHLDLKFRKRFSATLGWLWEQFRTDDMNNNFENVNYLGDKSFKVANQATTVTSSMLMGTWPQAYSANVYYATLKYRF